MSDEPRYATDILLRNCPETPTNCHFVVLDQRGEDVAEVCMTLSFCGQLGEVLVKVSRGEIPDTMDAPQGGLH